VSPTLKPSLPFRIGPINVPEKEKTALAGPIEKPTSSGRKYMKREDLS
jgi:hypothetical protein